MLSFDVVSLFTTIPVDKACEYTNKLLHSKQPTNLDTNDIISLLNFVLSNNYFVYNDMNYKQIHGCSIDSSVSPVVANLRIEAIEELAIKSTAIPPQLRERYVNDSFCIIKRLQSSPSVLKTRGLDYVCDAGYEITAHSLSSQRYAASSSYHLGFTVKICKRSIRNVPEKSILLLGKKKKTKLVDYVSYRAESYAG